MFFFQSRRYSVQKMFVAFFCIFTINVIPAFAQSSDNGQFYPNPGIVAQRSGNWVGSDHLYNITDKIDIVVEIFKPQNTDIPITEDMIRSRTVEIFKEAGIQPYSEAKAGEPFLPFFHILIMLYPIEKVGYAVHTEGRLFEKIYLDRVKLEEGTTLQAITWQSENLILTPTEDFTNQLNKSIDEIAHAFADRFRYFEKLKAESQRR
ncbi:MAG: hypothetical protein K940chlam7_01340 [Chlamydiae bacterium]|nr:hypothetical protein [Chlamydiota bacterium]